MASGSPYLHIHINNKHLPSSPCLFLQQSPNLPCPAHPKQIIPRCPRRPRQPRPTPTGGTVVGMGPILRVQSQLGLPRRTRAAAPLPPAVISEPAFSHEAGRAFSPKSRPQPTPWSPSNLARRSRTQIAASRVLWSSPWGCLRCVSEPAWPGTRGSSYYVHGQAQFFFFVPRGL